MIHHHVGFRSLLAAGVGAAIWLVGAGGAFAAYEVWVLDQGTNTLLIYGGDTLAADARPEKIDLASHGGAKPHMILFSPRHDYAFIANVGSGHVYVMRANDRKIVFNEDLGQQTHAVVPSRRRTGSSAVCTTPSSLAAAMRVATTWARSTSCT